MSPSRYPSKEALIGFYIEQNHTLVETSKHFRVPLGSLRKLLKQLGIVKSKDLISENISRGLRSSNSASQSRSEAQTAVTVRAIEASADSRRFRKLSSLLKAGLSKDQVYNDYILENKSLRELGESYSMSKMQVRKLLVFYGLRKSQKLIEDARIRGNRNFRDDPKRVAAHVMATQDTIRKLYGNNWYRNSQSTGERALFKKLQEAFPRETFVLGDYSRIVNPATGSPLQLDILLPSAMLAIEFNGNYWHNRDLFELDLLKGTAESREALKSKLCEAAGIELLHVWESDWGSGEEAIVSRLCLAISSRLI